jgi:hypothetical protein
MHPDRLDPTDLQHAPDRRDRRERPEQHRRADHRRPAGDREVRAPHSRRRLASQLPGHTAAKARQRHPVGPLAPTRTQEMVVMPALARIRDATKAAPPASTLSR